MPYIHRGLLVGVRLLEKTKPELYVQNPAHRFVYPALWNPTFPDQFAYVLVPINPVHVHVHAGHDALVESLLQILRSGV